MMVERIMFDAKFMEEARNILADHKKMLKKKMPEGWELYTQFAPIQYEKTVTLGKRKYIGYLRSRWGYPFSIEIYEKGRKFKLKKLVFSHKSVDVMENNPPLKSMKILENRRFSESRRSEASPRIIDRHLEKMKKEFEETGRKNI